MKLNLGLIFLVLSFLYIVRMCVLKYNINNNIEGNTIGLPHYVGIATVKPPRPPSRLMYKK